MRRGTFAASHGRTLIEDAVDRANEILATHEVPPLPEDVDRHIDEVIAAQRRLLASTV
jgi:trimethylamine:corrinoid methyltransferase-like protein